MISEIKGLKIEIGKVIKDSFVFKFVTKTPKRMKIITIICFCVILSIILFSPEEKTGKSIFMILKELVK